MSTRLGTLARPGKFMIGVPARLGTLAAPLGKVLVDYLVIWTIGNLFGPIFWLLVACRVIRINGYSRLLRAAWRGQLILAANHPTLIETLLIPAMGWPWMLVSRRFFFWCMPDHNLFPKGLKWLHPVTRGIVVDRKEKDKERSKRAIRKSIEVLRQPNTLVVHVEGGRTFKWQERQVKLLQQEDRQISEIKPQVFTLAKRSDAWILPLYVDMSPKRRQQRNYRQGAKALLQPGFDPITFWFDHPAYQVAVPFDPAQEKAKLEHLLLNP